MTLAVPCCAVPRLPAKTGAYPNCDILQCDGFFDRDGSPSAEVCVRTWSQVPFLEAFAGTGSDPGQDSNFLLSNMEATGCMKWELYKPPRA